MLSSILISWDPNTAAVVEQIAGETGVIHSVWSGYPPPDTPELVRILRAKSPDLLLLDVSDPELCLPVLERVRKGEFRTVVVGYRARWNRHEQAELEDAGVRQLLEAPFSAGQLEAAIYRALHDGREFENPNLLAFLPAKAGSGCSTVVLNAAFALAQEQQARVLVLEADRRSGVLSILLNQPARGKLADALAAADSLTGLDWSQHYAEAFGVHFLLADPARRTAAPTWAQYFHLLGFLRSRYDFILADLPEVVNPATVEIVRTARASFVVATPEIPSLRMSAVRLGELTECGLAEDRCPILLNRVHRDALSVGEVEKLLGRPVFATFPNEYARILTSTIESRPVAQNTRFYEACAAFGRRLTQRDRPAAEAPVRSPLGFLGRLSRLGAQS